MIDIVVWRDIEDVLRRASTLGGTNLDMFRGSELAIKYITSELEKKRQSLKEECDK